MKRPDNNRADVRRKQNCLGRRDGFFLGAEQRASASVGQPRMKLRADVPRDISSNGFRTTRQSGSYDKRLEPEVAHHLPGVNAHVDWFQVVAKKPLQGVDKSAQANPFCPDHEVNSWLGPCHHNFMVIDSMPVAILPIIEQAVHRQNLGSIVRVRKVPFSRAFLARDAQVGAELCHDSVSYQDVVARRGRRVTSEREKLQLFPSLVWRDRALA
jgi:hypothetical protein